MIGTFNQRCDGDMKKREWYIVYNLCLFLLFNI